MIRPDIPKTDDNDDRLDDCVESLGGFGLFVYGGIELAAVAFALFAQEQMRVPRVLPS